MTQRKDAFEPIIVVDSPEVTRWHAIYARVRPYFRKARMQLFEQRIAPTAASRVLDVGGSNHNWEYASVLPKVTLANIIKETRPDPRFQYMEFDARRMPLEDRSFDIVYSNSVIEHVGDFEDQKACAAEIRRVAKRYFVQTPAKFFPVEPHFFCLFIHWLPRPLYRRLLGVLSPWAWITKATPADVDKAVAGTRLLTVREMRELFPDAEIVRERFLGLTKSIVAIRV
ncbi:MAG: class I SAM-dependent methyltransferase [Hyphomicrobiaceae bacterium]